LKTLVIGDLNVDIIVLGAPHLPILGQEIPCEDMQIVMGGSASIFACRLAQLGAKVDILGKVGNDHNGRIVLDSLKLSSVGTDKVIVEDNLRTGITLSLTYPKNKAQVTYIGSIDSLVASDIKPELFHGYGHLHISSIYLQRKLLGSFREIFASAKRDGLITSLDTGVDPGNRYEHIDEILGHVDIFLPNDAEARGITKSEDIETALEILNSKVPMVVIKCGDKGAIGKADTQIVRLDALKIDPIDTTGAGDSFDAGFIYFFLHKREGFEASMKFANALGALSCLYVGGAEKKISEEDVLSFMKKQFCLPK